MANRDAPRGLRPAYHRHGGTIRTEKYRIASAYNTSIGMGDPVVLVGTNKHIARGTPGTAPFVGVFAGCSWTGTDGKFNFSPYWPASTATLGSADAEALVWADPNIVFEIQSDGPTAEADIGQTADVVMGTVDTATGNGKSELDDSNIGTGANLYIHDIVRRDDNEVAVADVKVYVLINEHQMNNAGAANIGTA